MNFFQILRRINDIVVCYSTGYVDGVNSKNSFVALCELAVYGCFHNFTESYFLHILGDCL